MTLQSGANPITVLATDLAGNQTSDSRTINLDQNAPSLVIITPADNSKTAIAQATVTGTVDETSTVTVKLGDNVQNAMINGTIFSADVTIVPGSNTIEVTATDLAGNSSTQKRTVIYDDQAPSLAVTVPSQDIYTNQPQLTILGTAFDPYTGVSVTVNLDGQTYTPAVTNGQFSQVVGFSTEKTYAIVVTAVNEVGKSTIVQRNVIYEVTPPTLTIDPVTTPTTQTGQIVTGTKASGLTVMVACDTAVVGSVTYPADTTWSVTLSGMQIGDNNITVTSSDKAGNTATVQAKILVTDAQSNTFSFAVFGANGVAMSGGAYTDSYVGSPSSHVAGAYRHGDIGTNSSQLCGIRMSGGSQGYGSALVGPGASLGTTICLSDWSAVNGTSGTLQIVKDMTPRRDPGAGTNMGVLNLTGNNTKTVTTGNYRFSSISLTGKSKLTLSGQITLHIDGNMTITGNSNIVVASGSVVTIYANGNKIDIAGGSIVNATQEPSNFIIYGSAGLQTVNLSGGTSLHGLIFAPAAAIKIAGGQETYGSVIGNTVELTGGAAVHYPEGLIK